MNVGKLSKFPKYFPLTVKILTILRESFQELHKSLQSITQSLLYPGHLCLFPFPSFVDFHNSVFQFSPIFFYQPRLIFLNFSFSQLFIYDSKQIIPTLFQYWGVPESTGCGRILKCHLGSVRRNAGIWMSRRRTWHNRACAVSWQLQLFMYTLSGVTET